MSSATDFAQAASAVATAESIHEGKYIHTYQGKLASNQEQVRFLTLSPEIDDTDAIEAFRQTAGEWANINTHPNIVSVYDRGGEPRPWIAVENVTGQPLDAVQPSLSPLETKAVIVHVAEALRNAVLYNTYHLDLRPDYIWVRPDEEDITGLVDGWGLNRAVRTALDETDITPFTAPEVISESDISGEQTDVYGLGALAYLTLTGQPPITASTDIASDIEGNNITPPSEVDDSLSPDVDEIVMQALAKDPADRPDSAYSFKQAFRQAFTPPEQEEDEGAVVAAGSAANDTEQNTGETDADSTVSRRTALGMLGTGAVGLGGGWLVTQMEDDSEQAAAAAPPETSTPTGGSARTDTSIDLNTPTDTESPAGTNIPAEMSLNAQGGLTYNDGFVYTADSENIKKFDISSEEVISSFAVPADSRSRGLAFGNDSLWFADRIEPDYDGSIAELNPETGEIRSTIESSWDPMGLAYGGNSLWSVDITTNRIVEYDTDGNSLSSFDTDGITWGMGLAYFDGSLWLGNNCGSDGCTVSLRKYSTDGELLQETAERTETAYGGLTTIDSKLYGPDLEGNLTVLRTLQS